VFRHNSVQTRGGAVFSFLEVEDNYLSTSKTSVLWSFQARDRKMVGDLQGAQHYGSTARNLNIAATVLIGLICLIVIIVYSIIAGRISAMHNSYGRYGQ
uniref:Uncharacterized protein n=1 Tax=Acanthochromis polyacanthus TaxID=80966 RepID=A0A3Q1G3M6_9TELE